MRIATLIGKVGNGRPFVIDAPAEGNDIVALIDRRAKLIASGGLLESGKKEMKLSELRLIDSMTGELKSAFKF